eukprot:Plantae.Rhodophyta-Hildenbrandia_rubra.ctg4011.p1 GENE.Plantae.Rhodophyta-Hildenbrandia_rubra.ctg4011~~Plantae.Rhodophyta-Hildenbrandia_rubra.ctg4011.p1  ORF type:complete len:652 (-),score=48.04 Plantae.Rhodophyta-Hildenbrandia_rubra.ctg4011:1456-3411(-)
MYGTMEQENGMQQNSDGNPYDVKGAITAMLGAVWRRDAKIGCRKTWIQDVVRSYLEFLDGVPYSRVPFTCEYLEDDRSYFAQFWNTFDTLSEGEGRTSKIMLDLYRRGSAFSLGLYRLGYMMRLSRWTQTDVGQIWRDGCVVKVAEADLPERVRNPGVYSNRVGVLNEILVRLDMFRCDPSRWALLGGRRYCDRTTGVVSTFTEYILSVFKSRTLRINIREIINSGRPYEGNLHRSDFVKRVYVNMDDFNGAKAFAGDISSSFEYLLKVSELRPSVCLGVAVAVHAGIQAHFKHVNAGVLKENLILGKYVAARTLVLIAGNINDSSRYGDKKLNISILADYGCFSKWWIGDVYSRVPCCQYKHRRNMDELDFNGDEAYWAMEVLRFLNGGYMDLPMVSFDQDIQLVDANVLKMISIVCAAMQVDFGAFFPNRIMLLNRDVLGRGNHHFRRYNRIVEKLTVTNDGVISDISPIAVVLLWGSILVNLISPIPSVLSTWKAVEALEKYLAITAPFLIMLAILEYFSPHPDYIKSLMRGRLKITGSGKLALYLGLSRHETIRLLSRSKRRNEILSPIGPCFVGKEAQGSLAVECIARPRETVGFDSVWSNTVIIRPHGAFKLRETSLGKYEVDCKCTDPELVLSLESSIPILGII